MRPVTQRGLTLLELVVTLLVLTVLTSIAIRSVSGIEEFARFEKSKRLLEELRLAIAGDDQMRGYWFDLATFPPNLRQLLTCNACDGTTEENPIAWNPALAAVSYRQEPSASLISAALGYGWNGPYLATTASPDDPDAVRDGFGGLAGTLGNTTNYGFGLAFDSASLVITSYGADHQPGPSGYCGQDSDYEEDCALSLKRNHFALTLPNPITVRLTPPNTGQSPTVFLALFFRSANDLANHLASAFSTTSLAVTENGTPTSLNFNVNGYLPAGPILVGLFRCDGYSSCPPSNLAAFLAGDRVIYPDQHGLTRLHLKPRTASLVIDW